MTGCAVRMGLLVIVAFVAIMILLAESPGATCNDGGPCVYQPSPQAAPAAQRRPVVRVRWVRHSHRVSRRQRTAVAPLPPAKPLIEDIDDEPLPEGLVVQSFVSMWDERAEQPQLLVRGLRPIERIVQAMPAPVLPAARANLGAPVMVSALFVLLAFPLLLSAFRRARVRFHWFTYQRRLARWQSSGEVLRTEV